MSKEEYAVEVENISKIYTLRNKNNQYKTDKKEFYALKDVSFKVKKGDVVGILGTNGSGKSTLSLLLSGISEINSGTMKINGEQALIAINTGLNQQLTGLENINVKGALMGLRKKRIQEITNDVIDFAELGDFLYQPVKKYSSGMKSRLGFSISLALNPDIFIVDEALSVGDKGFAKKCMKRMMKLRDEEGKTIFFISHSLSQVREFCKTGMWIEGGQLVEMGDIDKVCDDWLAYKKPIIKESTYLNYAFTIKERFEKDFENKTIDYFFHYDLNHYIELLQEKLSNKTIREHITIFKSILKYAERKYDFDFKLDLVSLPKADSKQLEIFSDNEVKKIENYIINSKDFKNLGVLISLYSGLRIGEVCALRW